MVKKFCKMSKFRKLFESPFLNCPIYFQPFQVQVHKSDILKLSDIVAKLFSALVHKSDIAKLSDIFPKEFQAQVHKSDILKMSDVMVSNLRLKFMNPTLFKRPVYF